MHAACYVQEKIYSIVFSTHNKYDLDLVMDMYGHACVFLVNLLERLYLPI